MTNDNGFGVFAEQGTGKTLPTLIHLSNLLMSGKIQDALIVAPLSALGAWSRDMLLLNPIRKKILEDKVTLVNYDKLSRKTSTLRKDYDRDWGCIVLDEAHAIKNHTSNRSKYLLKLSTRANYRYILTGTPITNKKLEDFYSLMNFIHPGTFPNRAEFEARYLYQRELPGTHVKITTGYRNKEELLNIVGKHSIRIQKSECLDLPDKLPDEVVYCENAESKVYKEALKDFIEEFDIVIDRPVTRMLKLRQICSGFVNDEFGETVRLKCNKLNTLSDMIESIGGKVVVFAEFKESIKQIQEVIKKMKLKQVTLDGNQKNKQIWKDFQSDPSIDVIICQYASACSGIDLFASTYMIFYEPSLSTTVVSQCRDRIHRIGVKGACSYYWLINKGTIEEQIYRRILGGEDFSNDFLRNLIINNEIK